MARIDVRLIVQVIINIVNNAVKYTPAGSHILLRAEKQGTMVAVSRLPMTVPESPTRPRRICSTCSIRPARGRPTAAGGLAWGSASADPSSAPMAATSPSRITIPHGAVFTFTLPFRGGEISMYKAENSGGGGRSGHQQSDSHHAGNAGLPVSYRPNRRPAHLMEAVSYNPDVIILDLGLPDMDGVDIIKKVRGWSKTADHRRQRPQRGSRTRWRHWTPGRTIT